MHIRRIAPLALVSASALVLAGCASAAPTDDATTAADGACMTVSSGSTSDSVTVEGDFGSTVTATFDTPLEASSLERTVVEEGDGDVTVKGENVSSHMTIYVGSDGTEVLSETVPLEVGGEATFDAFNASIDCLPIGSRVVTTVPASDLFGETGNESAGIAADDSLIIVTDIIEKVVAPTPVEWTENVPEVTFDADGIPTVTIPDADPSDELVLKVLKEGDGETVAEGDQVTLNYQGVQWSDGTVFDESYTSAPATFGTNQVIAGFGAALVGQKVGTQLIVSIPPKDGYGEDASSNPLGGQTLVFLIDITDVTAG